MKKQGVRLKIQTYQKASKHNYTSQVQPHYKKNLLWTNSLKQVLHSTRFTLDIDSKQDWRKVKENSKLVQKLKKIYLSKK